MKQHLISIRRELIKLMTELSELDSSEVHERLQILTAIVEDLLNEPKIKNKK